jgi:hypothetical protein
MRNYHHIDIPYASKEYYKPTCCDKEGCYRGFPEAKLASVAEVYSHFEERHEESALQYLLEKRWWGGSWVVSYKACPFRECSYSATDSFSRDSEIWIHLKKEHDYSRFPCEELGCDRKGGNGYSRKVDLVKHQRKMHNGNGEFAEL